jgi:hypothetical protein
MSKITVETQSVFKTTDGKSWTDEALAKSHQALLDHGGLIDGYVKAHPATFAVQGAEGRARGVLAPFLGWLSGQDGCTLPEPITEAAAPEATSA